MPDFHPAFKNLQAPVKRQPTFICHLFPLSGIPTAPPLLYSAFKRNDLENVTLFPQLEAKAKETELCEEFYIEFSLEFSLLSLAPPAL